MLDLLDSRRLRYLLAALLRIAASPQPVSGRHLAEILHCPRRYLEPDMQALVAAGILQSRRGAGGGYSLARNAQRIALSDILTCLQSLEEKQQPDACRLQHAVVMPLLKQAKASCHGQLKAWTLASFLHQAEQQGLIQVSDTAPNFSI
ncbi:MAG: Rrf2 family transcriptional regulator [Mariprofundaceae bacterium]|nr:Rrf2 family transcriptional regulator [Mariprofundaceae bacterium]